MQDVIDGLPAPWAGAFAALRNSSGAVHQLHGVHGEVEVSMQAGDADILTIVPLAEGPNGVRFAPLGLADMLNSGGAVQSWTRDVSGFTVRLRGEGRFVVSCSEPPKGVTMDGDALAQGKLWRFEDSVVSVDVQADTGPVQHVLAFSF